MATSRPGKKARAKPAQPQLPGMPPPLPPGTIRIFPAHFQIGDRIADETGGMGSGRPSLHDRGRQECQRARPTDQAAPRLAPHLDCDGQRRVRVVMWEHVWYAGAKQHLPGYGQTWTPTGAVKTQSDCERGQASMERQWSAPVDLSPRHRGPARRRGSAPTQAVRRARGIKQGARHGVSNDYSPLLRSPDGRNPRATSPSVTPSPA